MSVEESLLVKAPALGFTSVPDLTELIERLRGLARTGGPDMNSQPYVLSTERYLDPDRFAVEVEHIFRRKPLLLGISADLPNVGDFKTLEIAGSPILLVRGRDNVARAFFNACLHRGTAVVQEDQGYCASRFVCPWHGWTFDTQGTLVGVPFRSGFPGVELRQSGLKPLPIQEKYGLIYGRVEGSEPVDVDDHLGSIVPEIAAMGFDDAELGATYTLRTPVNWKLLNDTFCENYHFAPLHRDTVPTAIPNVSTVDYYGAHVRLTFATKLLSDSCPHDAAELMNPAYLLFPNVVVVPGPYSLHWYTMLPTDKVDESIIIMRCLYRRGISEEIKQVLAAAYDFVWNHIITVQDIPVTQHAMKSYKSHAIRELIVGRNESAIHHIHAQQDAIVSSAGFVGE